MEGRAAEERNQQRPPCNDRYYGFLSEEAIPGSVPGLKGLVPNHGPFNAMDPFHFTNINGIPSVM